MSKDLWFAEMERLIAKYIDEGMSEDEAYDKASDRAYDSMRERLFDQADYLRKIAKGE